MLRIVSAAAAGLLAVLAVMVCGGQPALAYGEHSWCAVYNMGWGDEVWECTYDSIEACRPNVIAGNRGFCNENPWYKGPAKRSAPRRQRRH
jgi:Protein of unknown function (DUF3551)